MQDASRTAVPKYISIPRWIVDSRVFVVTTTLLTVYALIGDDVRLMATDKPDDNIFTAITIICMVVFTVEIVLSSLGKDDYFLGFFFVLDIVSTVSLVMDLQYVQDWLSGLTEGEEGEVDNARASRTAKIGARLGRILRLVRIIKLYKVAYDRSQRKKNREAREASRTRAEPGDDNDDWLDEENEENQQRQPESKVGKKLSELTTRRVIVLVLVMMFVIPWLRIDQAAQLPFSAYYGADLVHEAFSKMDKDNETPAQRQAYEDALLQYIYYHNWYTGHSSSCPHGVDNCPRNYDSHLFWIGIAAKDESKLDGLIRRASVQNAAAVQTWEEKHISKRMMYNFGPMPDTVKSSILSWRWDATCPGPRSTSFHKMGMSVLQEEVVDFNGASNNYPVTCPEQLRSQERKEYFPRLNVLKEEFQEWHFVFYFDIRPYVFWDAFFSLMITIFVILSLLVAALLFTSDANHLVLNPVESMISKVEAIRHDPMMARRMADKEFNLEEIAKARKSQHQARSKISRVGMLYTFKDKFGCWPKVNASELMETVVLEKTIIKLGTLLALGFGEAGASIIEHNMHGIDSASVNAMVEGTKVDCVIGVARIRDFSTVTEVLQAKVMTFVNQIAEIVHGVVDEFHGAANRNNGDMFLMIWRTSVKTLKDNKKESEEEEDDNWLSKMADMSVLAFTRILGAIHRSPVLEVYRHHPGLQQRLQGANCRVNLSCGLHFGWAIEGAVGSEFKIDASYLSPNVSIAESVERAAESIYGVSILLTESVKKSCNPGVANKFRLIDCVKISGSKDPMEIYVMDLCYSGLQVDKSNHGPTTFTSRQRYNVRKFMDSEKERKKKPEVSMEKYFNEGYDIDIAKMRAPYTREFLHVFNMGYQNYAQGEWKVAQRFLQKTKINLSPRRSEGKDIESSTSGEDGPSAALLKYMEQESVLKSGELEAPPWWKGVRELSLGRGAS